MANSFPATADALFGISIPAIPSQTAHVVVVSARFVPTSALEPTHLKEVTRGVSAATVAPEPKQDTVTNKPPTTESTPVSVPTEGATGASPRAKAKKDEIRARQELKDGQAREQAALAAAQRRSFKEAAVELKEAELLKQAQLLAEREAELAKQHGPLGGKSQNFDPANEQTTSKDLVDGTGAPQA